MLANLLEGNSGPIKNKTFGPDPKVILLVGPFIKTVSLLLGRAGGMLINDIVV